MDGKDAAGDGEALPEHEREHVHEHGREHAWADRMFNPSVQQKRILRYIIRTTCPAN